MNVKTLTLTGDDIPGVLQQIPNPPGQLFVAGNLGNLLRRARLAVIGSRKLSTYGRGVTSLLTEALASHGVVIVSGLALGADGVAHQAALNTGGQTIAVLPAGLDRIYPATHHHLAQQILEQGGALVTEYPPGSEPYPSNFLARNRLVSGLSDGVLITEAAERSGTLATANYALEQGRPVMAVPGNITSPLSTGTNNLIKAGATPVTQPEDVLALLNLEVVSDQKEVVAHNDAEQTLIDLLQTGITDGTELQAKSRLAPATFNQTLTMLEITGRIKSLGANHWMIK
jgi:DNA processing protein